jgi:integrase
MSSLCKGTQQGAWIVRLSPNETGDGRRPKINLGKCNKKQATTARVHIENLISARRLGTSAPMETTGWVSSLAGGLRKRLETLGLIEKRERDNVPSVADWTQRYIDSRHDTKSSTLSNLGMGRANLVEFFPDKLVDEITPADADAFAAWMRTEGKIETRDGKPVRVGYASATVGRRLKMARQFFKGAVKAGFIPSNPFADVKVDAMTNPERLHYVEIDDIAKVIDACPGWEWRLVWGLARYAGLRIPSDTENLTLESVNLEKNFIWIKSPKTEHLKSRGLRRVPIAIDLMPLLLDAIEHLPEGETHLLPTLCKRDNLRTHGHRIIRRAGLVPWEKVFQNCRASCETDWADKHGIRKACQWIGNNPQTMMAHYAIMKDSDFLADTGDFEVGATVGATDGARQQPQIVDR